MSTLGTIKKTTVNSSIAASAVPGGTFSFLRAYTMYTVSYASHLFLTIFRMALTSSGLQMRKLTYHSTMEMANIESKIRSFPTFHYKLLPYIFTTPLYVLSGGGGERSMFQALTIRAIQGACSDLLDCSVSINTWTISLAKYPTTSSTHGAHKLPLVWENLNSFPLSSR